MNTSQSTKAANEPFMMQISEHCYSADIDMSSDTNSDIRSSLTSKTAETSPWRLVWLYTYYIR